MSAVAKLFEEKFAKEGGGNPNHDEHGRFSSGEGGGGKVWDKEDLTLTHKPTGSTVDIRYDGKNYAKDTPRQQALITGVETPEANRNKGGAHAVMNQVENFLDQHGVVGRLNAGSDDLQRLYGKHGFVQLTKNRFEMFREPKMTKRSFAKDNPTVGDVHVASTSGGKRKAKLFSVAYGGVKKDWAQFDAERAAAGGKGGRGARQHLQRLKDKYAAVGREEGWDSPEAKAAEKETECPSLR